MEPGESKRWLKVRKVESEGSNRLSPAPVAHHILFWESIAISLIRLLLMLKLPLSSELLNTRKNSERLSIKFNPLRVPIHKRSSPADWIAVMVLSEILVGF